MAGKKKKQQAEFAGDKNAFAGGSPKKGDSAVHKAKQKQSGAHQPRDADVKDADMTDATSGHGVQKSGQPETFSSGKKNSTGKSGLKPGQPKNVRHGGSHSTGRKNLTLQNKPDSGAFQDNQNNFQGDTRKIAGQKAKPGQKKRRKQVKPQKENSFTEGKEKQDIDSTISKPQDSFTEEQNIFTEEGGEQTEETKDSGDGYHRRDTYHQSEKKGRYRRRERKDRERTKQSDFERDFQTKDNVFTESNDFTEGAEPEFQGSKKLDRLQKKKEKAGKKLEAARKKLPKKKEYSLVRVFDEKTGMAKYVLAAVEKEKPFKKDNPIERMAGRVGAEFTHYAHGKVAESEKENSAVEGAHKTEQKAEDIYHFVKRHHKSIERRRREKVAKLEKKQFNKEVNFRYRKFLEENPEMQEKTIKKQLQKSMQKQRIKREYAKARRAGQAAKNTKEAAAKTAGFTTAAARKVQEIAVKHASLLVTAGAFVLLLIMVMAAISSCGAMLSGGMGSIVAGSYLSDPAEIDAADLAFSKLEMELQKKINSIETDYPDYDEYRYNLDAIGHDPFVLISYLSAVYTEFTAADVQGEIESLFNAMYKLTLTPVTETRTRTVTKTGTRAVTNDDGTISIETYTYQEEEEYTVTILEVTLDAASLDAVVAGRMDNEQKETYAIYNETHGLTQQFDSPLGMDWYDSVNSYYGYRINKATGEEQLHRGLDIAVPTGTTVFAAMDGTVREAAYDSHYGKYVVIEDGNGYCTKYAHMDTLSVSVGQAVKHGDTIGTTGNTGSSSGSHLHIECLYDGEYYNPLFYFETGSGALYGRRNAQGNNGRNATPPVPGDDDAVQALMEEAAKYLGYPYVWGGSEPSTGFDCSGFVCWVFTNSGVHKLPRTTAQGIYDQCTPVPAADAKAGDIIFFTGTYKSAGAVSHVGIYCGNGVMIHCGDPVQYADINTPYWQSHFYAFGRISGK